MKLTVLRGLPASGKSSYAYKAVRSEGNTFRLNRDTAREELFFSEWSGKREEKIIKLEEIKAKYLLENGVNVIIDNTHLREKDINRWKQFSEKNNVRFEVESFLDVPVEECVSRDELRDKSVGKAVIHRMALFAGLINFGDKPIVICDYDGTLSSGIHREHLVKNEKKDWKTYFSLCSQDEPIDFVIRWIRELAKENTICIVSGRPDSTQFDSMDWLDRYNVPYQYLFMRQSSDKRSDVEVKTDILNHLPKSKILMALDDRPIVVEEVWRKNGIKVYPVRGSIEPF